MQMNSPIDEQQLLTASELGKLLGRSTKSIQCDLYRKADSLPPRFKLPGTHKNLWRVKDVRDWMNAMADLMAEQRAKEIAFAKAQGIPATPSRPFHLGQKHRGFATTKHQEDKA